MKVALAKRGSPDGDKGSVLAVKRQEEREGKQMKGEKENDDSKNCVDSATRTEESTYLRHQLWERGTDSVCLRGSHQSEKMRNESKTREPERGRT